MSGPPLKNEGLQKVLKKLGPSAMELLYILLANFCYAAAVQFFFLENNIAAGGFAGIATVLNYLFPISVGNFVFLMNIPFILIALKVFGWRYTGKIFISTLVYTLMANLMEPLPVATHDRFAASVFGGVLYGVGAVLIMNAHTAGAGTDLVARLLMTRFKNLSLGKMFMCVDGSIVVLAVIVYRDLESGVYAVTAIAVCSYVTDRIISGFNVADICYVITSLDPEAMGQAIMTEMQVGVTLQRGEGMYAKTPRNVLMVVVRPKEIHRLKGIVMEHDPDAFVVVAWASEVTGGGFRNSADY